MKKLIAFFLVLSILFSFAGCKNSKVAAMDIVNSAYSKNANLKDIDVTITNAVQIMSDSGDYSTEVTETLKETNIGNKKYEMSSSIEERINGTLALNYDTYYQNGYFYTNEYEGSFKQKIGYSSVRVDKEIIPEKDLEKTESVEVKEDNGEKTIVFKANDDELKELWMDFGDDTKILDNSIKYVVNSKGYIKRYELNVSTEHKENGEAVSTKYVDTIEFQNIGKKVNPYNAEDKDYMEVEDLEVISSLYSSMLSTAAAENLEMDMEISAQFIKNNETKGYDRTYNRIYQSAYEQFAQKYKTKYFEGRVLMDEITNSQYFKDGIYQTENSSGDSRYYIEMDYKTFLATAFTDLSSTPIEMHQISAMKDIEKSENGQKADYEFSLRENSQGTVNFLKFIFGPYNNYNSLGGNLSEAKIDVKSFSGKIYTEADAVNKIKMSCEIVVKLEKETITVKAEQTINISSSSLAGQKKKITPPSIKNYTKIETSDFVNSYYQ